MPSIMEFFDFVNHKTFREFGKGVNNIEEFHTFTSERSYILVGNYLLYCAIINLESLSTITHIIYLLFSQERI